MSFDADIAIVGAGMAGASLAAEVAGQASVLLLEAEDRPGYHSTGRSAAFWSESYGGPRVQPLTTASGPFLADQGFLSPRGALHVADAEGESALIEIEAEFDGLVPFERVDRAALEARLPGLRGGWAAGLVEPSCADIDVAGLHAFCLAQARRRGARLVTGAEVRALARDGAGWAIETGAGTFRARIVANAAGAWADRIAAMAGAAPIGLQPYRRTLSQLRVDPPAPTDLPLVIDALGRFYFKPEAGGRLWLSPHDETACDPCDCAPEELDVAIAIDRLEQLVDWRVERVERSWAGLRSFAPDRLPVYGFDPAAPAFFWCAGQGGFGIQTAPAAARLAAALLLGAAPHPAVAAIDPAPYSPGRFPTKR
ncbi:MAG TPA: FAD-dependent oxidoreductase [Allosphingosinicella sp.]|jgi:D-arginine dehydrogenase|nr:FAD-dependent oxidoreductase [Allosphingosinicella sp.]